MYEIAVNGLKYYISYKEAQFLIKNFYSPIYRKMISIPGFGSMKRNYRNYNAPAKFGTDAKIKRLQRQVANISPELKTKQFSFSTSTPNATIAFVPLFEIAEGNGEDERIGDRIRVKSISIRGNVNAQLNNVDFYIVKYNFPTATPLYSHFLAEAGGHLSVNNGREIYHKLCSTGAYDQMINFKRNYKNLIVKYTANAAGTAIDHNNYFIVVKNLSGSTIIPRMSVEVKYTD